MARLRYEQPVESLPLFIAKIVAVAAVVIRAGAGLEGSGAYAVAFWVIAVLLVVALVEGVLMSRSAGEAIRPARRVRVQA